jgi:hypothetical protein
MVTQRKVSWTWTNWTFGFWYYKRRGLRRYGIDIGPFEVTWMERR